MKKFLSLLLVFCVLFTLVACKQEDELAHSGTTPPSTTIPEVKETTETPSETIAPEDMVNPELPEPTFPCLDAGTAPEVIYLSNFDCGYQYIFAIGEYEDTTAPRIVNDTEYNILDVSIVFDNNPAERLFCFNNTICNYSPLTQLATEEKTAVTMTLLFTPGTVDMALAEYATVKISDFEVGAELDMNGCNYIFNNTDYDVVIDVNGKAHSVGAQEIFESNNQFTHKLIHINHA